MGKTVLLLNKSFLTKIETKVVNNDKSKLQNIFKSYSRFNILIRVKVTCIHHNITKLIFHTTFFFLKLDELVRKVFCKQLTL